MTSEVEIRSYSKTWHLNLHIMIYKTGFEKDPQLKK